MTRNTTYYDKFKAVRLAFARPNFWITIVIVFLVILYQATFKRRRSPAIVLLNGAASELADFIFTQPNI